MKKFDFDVAVIGGGSGGYAAARTAAGAGLKTVVIEGGREVGGLSPNTPGRGACVPGKSDLTSPRSWRAKRSRSKILPISACNN